MSKNVSSVIGTIAGFLAYVIIKAATGLSGMIPAAIILFGVAWAVEKTLQAIWPEKKKDGK